MQQSSVFYRDLNNPPKILQAATSDGYIAANDTDDRVIIDVSSGSGNLCLGPLPTKRILEAVDGQWGAGVYAHAANFTTPATEELATKLLNLAGGRFLGGRVVFLSTGAEAIEAACKLSHQYQNRGTHTFIGRERSYHGATLFTLGLGDHPRKKDYSSLTMHTQRLPAFAPSRNELLMTNLYRNWKYSSKFPATTVVIETIGGTCAAIEPASLIYLQHMRKETDRVDGVLIYDEILCGNYRTGLPFAYQLYGGMETVEPDIVCIGKGLTGGFFPLSAVLVSKRIAEAIHQRDGVLHHSSTNQNHPLGCAIALAALEDYAQILRNDGMLEYQKNVGYCVEFLRTTDGVEQVVGVGGLWGIRLCKDDGSKIPHSAALIRRVLLQNGVAAYTEGGTTDEDGRDRMILWAPHYLMSRETMLQACSIIAQTLKEVL